MNRWRIAGVLLAAALALWLVLRGCAPGDEKEPAAGSPAPAQEVFHVSKPLRVVVSTRAPPAPSSSQANAGNTGLAAASRQHPIAQAQDAASAWLERELRHLLISGRMRVATMAPALPAPFTLRIELPQAPQTLAQLSLLAPDGKIDRSTEINLGASKNGQDALGIVQLLAKHLPTFLGATRIATNTADWTAFIGTDDRAAYDSFLHSSNELLGAQGQGFTAPSAPHSSQAVERLETLTRKHRRFSRAIALLSLGYASLGGEDDASLISIAESTAQRALAFDRTLVDAQSTLGLVRLRRGEWTAALEQFNSALALDANSPPALEGLACLLVDVGQAAAAMPMAQQAVALQPKNIGARECLAYAQLATGTNTSNAPSTPQTGDPLEVAQARALRALLAGDTAEARRSLDGSLRTSNASAWIDPLLQAAGDRQKTSQALQAITRAASDKTIDPVTEVICGAALRQADFVFNRMLRLHRQNEAVPLRLLWLPQTDFLRRHARFAEIIEAEALPPFWQDHGRPDRCVQEPAMYGCKARDADPVAKSAQR